MYYRITFKPGVIAIMCNGTSNGIGIDRQIPYGEILEEKPETPTIFNFVSVRFSHFDLP